MGGAGSYEEDDGHGRARLRDENEEIADFHSAPLAIPKPRVGW